MSTTTLLATAQVRYSLALAAQSTAWNAWATTSGNNPQLKSAYDNATAEVKNAEIALNAARKTAQFGPALAMSQIGTAAVSNGIDGMFPDGPSYAASVIEAQIAMNLAATAAVGSNALGNLGNSLSSANNMMASDVSLMTPSVGSYTSYGGGTSYPPYTPYSSQSGSSSSGAASNSSAAQNYANQQANAISAYTAQINNSISNYASQPQSYSSAASGSSLTASQFKPGLKVWSTYKKNAITGEFFSGKVAVPPKEGSNIVMIRWDNGDFLGAAINELTLSPGGSGQGSSTYQQHQSGYAGVAH